MSKIAAVALMLCCVRSAVAQTAPTEDQVFSKTEDHALSYKCALLKAGVVSCELNETSVRKRFDDARVCVVGSHTWKQEFKLIEQTGGSVTWVAQSKPEGPCGVVDLSRFEAAGTGLFASFFNIVRRKTVTNPNAVADPLVHPESKCSILEQPAIEFVATANDRRRPLSCGSFEFVPY